MMMEISSYASLISALSEEIVYPLRYLLANLTQEGQILFECSSDTASVVHVRINEEINVCVCVYVCMYVCMS